MIPNDILQKIDDETDLVSLVSEFISLEKRGKNYMGLCPFHNEKTPSFSVSPEKNIAMCMGCGEGGRPINFYRKIKNIPFQQAAYELAERMGIKLDINYKKQVDPHEEKYKLMEEAATFYTFNLFNSKSGEKGLDYLKKRSLKIETIRHFNLGYASNSKDQLYQILKDKGYSVSDMIDLGLVKQSSDGSYYDLFRDRLMFPITNLNGRVVGFSGRTLNKNDNIKYVNSPETVIFKKGNLLYHYNESSFSVRKMKHVVLYEGFFDVISAYQAGLENGIATMGTSLTKEHAKSIARQTKKVIIAFDGDDAGKKAAIASSRILLNEGLVVEILNIPEKMDPDDYIKEFGANKFDNLFMSNILDPFAFEYAYHKEKADFTNANDLIIFKENIIKMLSKTNGAIRELYKKRLAFDLNIEIDEIKIPTYTKYDYEQRPVIKPKKKKKRLKNKYEQAERRILFLMMRSKDWSDYIDANLTINEYAYLLNGTIRKKIASHYLFNNNFNLEIFLQEVTNEEKEYILNDLFKDDFWINEYELPKEEIDHYISLLKETTLIRRKKDLKEQISENFRKSQTPNKEMLEEYQSIGLTLVSKKEESNEF